MTLYGKQGNYFLSLVRPPERLYKDTLRGALVFNENKRRNNREESRQPKDKSLVDLVRQLAGV